MVPQNHGQRGWLWMMPWMVLGLPIAWDLVAPIQAIAAPQILVDPKTLDNPEPIDEMRSPLAVDQQDLPWLETHGAATNPSPDSLTIEIPSLAIDSPDLPEDPSIPTPAEELAPPDPPDASDLEPLPEQKPEELEGTFGNSDSDPDKPDDIVTEEEAEQQQRQQLLIEADRLYEQGRYAEAEALYREAKEPWESEGLDMGDRPNPFSDPELLAPGARVYWRETLAGQELGLETRTLVPLNLLVQDYPEFIPAHLRYAELLQEYDRPDEALTVLERATALYPHDQDLVRARVSSLAEAEEWLEASLAARQFALLNGEDPSAPEFLVLAEEYQDRFRSQLRGQITRNAIANVVTGALGYALTGGLFGPLSAVDSALLLIRGESAVGEAIANQALDQLELINDPEVVDYVNTIGQQLATVAGRDEFDYRFYVVRSDELNAFALPGGHVFINAEAITRTQSEAELAGLIAHELAHVVLSHGFQLVTSGNLTANLLQVVPYGGGIAADLITLDYSRSMERQADELGTRILTAAGYSADGLHNLMQTLATETDRNHEIVWLSTHPDTDERIHNLRRQIQEQGYNRFGYEGVAQHLEIQQRVEALLAVPDEAIAPQKRPVLY